LRATRISQGRLVQQFEEALSGQLGLVRPAAVNSGSRALHLGLDLAGVEPGDEVDLPAHTFVATGHVVLMQRATPLFADIDPMTGNLAPASIREKITERTRAIVPVHWSGCPCELDEINAIADAHDLAVVEDAAQALGATYKGSPIGSISRITAFSFQAVKQLTTGDGGAPCCRDEWDYRLARRRRWLGMDCDNDKPDLLGERGYNLDHLGDKYHMNDVAAAIGLGNLETFSTRLARRRSIASRYGRALSGVSDVTLLRSAHHSESAYWQYSHRVERRLDFIRKPAAHCVLASVIHLRIDRNKVFGGLREDLVGQGLFNADHVAIPVHEGLSDDDVDHVIRTIRSGW
jgi:perosamine synthetase